MKKWLRNYFVIAFAMLLSNLSLAQNITKFEYFIDSDPGIGLATQVPVIPATQITNLNIPISTSSLSPGFHTLYIRSQNASGQWTHTHIRTFFVDNTIVAPTISSFNPSSGLVGSTVIITGTNFSSTPANNIVRFNGVAATVTVSSATSLTVTVPAGATTGPITVTVVGLTATSSSSFTVNSPNITAAEYFFNVDPGPGNGTAIPITIGTNIDIVNFDIVTTSLPVGWHTVHVRMRDANNVWGFYESRKIYVRGPVVIEPIPPVAPVAQMEFFYDTDNGVGTGSVISITPSHDVDVVNTNLTNTLTQGWHTVHVRTKNQDNIWGFYESRKIFIRGEPEPCCTPPSPIVELEYFVDNDPGVGLSSTKVTINPSSTNIDLVDELLDVGTQSLGAHRIYVRAKNQAGTWSMSEQANFSVITSCPILTAPSATGVVRCDPGPVTLTASGASAGETYRWYATASSVTPLFTGNPYTTTSLSANTTFYVTAYNPTTFCESARTPVTGEISGIIKPVLSISGSLTVCEGTTQLITAPPGFSSYTWSNGLTTQQITAATTGSYSVVVNNGVCSSPSSDPFVFTVNARPVKPTITATNGGSLCGTGTVTLNAPAGLSAYAWSTGATTPSIDVTSAGNFTVNVTNPAGCQSVQSDPFPVTSTAIPKPSITVTGNTSLCNSATVTLDAPAGYSTYSWSNGANTQQIIVNTAASYTVTVSNGSCTSPSSDAVVVTTATIPAKPVITVTGNTALCNGAFTVLAAPAGFSSYLWSNGETTRQILVTTAGSFTVQTGNAGNCLSLSSDAIVITHSGLACVGGSPVTLSPPTVAGGSNCGVGTVLLSVSGATGLEYRWYDEATGGTSLSSLASFTTPTLQQTTDFYVSVFDPILLIESIRVRVTATIILFSKPAITPAGPVAICSGSSISVAAPTGFTHYRWIKDGNVLAITTQQLSILQAGSYSVETGDGTCFSVPSDPITITVDAPPAKPTISGSAIICGSGTTTLTSTDGSEYLWSTNETTKTISVSAGIYSVTIKNGSCTSTSDPITVRSFSIPSKPVITIVGKEVICAGSVVALSAPAGFSNYKWSNGETTQVIATDKPGSYSVQTGNSPECLSASSDLKEIRMGTLAECGLVPSPTNRPPEIDAASFGVQIQSEATHSLTSLIHDDDDNLDISSLRIIDGPAVSGKPSGGKATIDAEQNLLLDYRGVNFSGKESITLQVCDSNGLCAQQQITVDVVGDVVVFNGMTPDGDGINDFMYIQFIDIIEGARKNKVIIMNRWGDIVFEIDDYDNAGRSFTGIDKNGKELPGGTYLYKVSLGTDQTYSGFITLKR